MSEEKKSVLDIQIRISTMVDGEEVGILLPISEEALSVVFPDFHLYLCDKLHTHIDLYKERKKDSEER